MAQELNKAHKTWITNELTSHLIKNLNVSSCENPIDHIQVKSVEIKPMSLEVAFMLTNCYFVKIVLNTNNSHKCCKNEQSERENVFDLVVKVM